MQIKDAAFVIRHNPDIDFQQLPTLFSLVTKYTDSQTIVKGA
ncbi:hypothetical protein [Lentilactobacillus hilgardii]|uniref:Uncharacterized protein n=1 Tax=Lentilactobacillus hilgardii (strain ATCC 8290 / DSM 20176 / CCUG 30140 / JCM 1155 / KCTC 3500 / NBRC 15886 / NCIMB 8040 / NRRL B-1843 / 9) TaxID=1423757 RepID=C0XMK3_LENH9|nr:hypothetical protein [Lentilactobacillus hilgardii]EEI18438.1 hypothetical protein HMPREF0497_2732 [Lentilactobacillus buchneri ATCC 11577]EEI23374.1 hypothetical protein HMPREF0519_2464 [Lentilactobacillus hilgardii DSM 20176 = ATCC 8290]